MPSTLGNAFSPKNYIAKAPIASFKNLDMSYNKGVLLTSFKDKSMANIGLGSNPRLPRKSAKEYSFTPQRSFMGMPSSFTRTGEDSARGSQQTPSRTFRRSVISSTNRSYMP